MGSWETKNKKSRLVPKQSTVNRSAKTLSYVQHSSQARNPACSFALKGFEGVVDGGAPGSSPFPLSPHHAFCKPPSSSAYPATPDSNRSFAGHQAASELRNRNMLKSWLSEFKTGRSAILGARLLQPYHITLFRCLPGHNQRRSTGCKAYIKATLINSN